MTKSRDLLARLKVAREEHVDALAAWEDGGSAQGAPGSEPAGDITLSLRRLIEEDDRAIAECESLIQAAERA